MSISVRISDETYQAAKKTGRAEYRSIPNQIEYWAMIGRCGLENPDLPVEFIKDILESKDADDSQLEPFEFGNPNG